MQTYTYLKYICVITQAEYLLIDMDTLKLVEFSKIQDIDKFSVREKKQGIYKYVRLEPIIKSTKGLWSISENQFNTDGKVFERNIVVKTKNYQITLTLSYMTDCTDKNNIDRNNIDFKIQGKKELSKENYTGALICQGQNIVKNILTE